MARTIQPEANRLRHGGLKTIVGHLGTAIFWLIVAILFPVEVVARLVPQLADRADWLPLVFYGLAIWNFIRFARGVRGLTGSVRRSVTGPAGRESAPRAPSSSNLPAIDRRPTVQRMR